ncbi:hypothetical protein [Pantoea agglomerans]|uniref:hypothetical protein n=1 Tax=Enterobacter agglomerans TaxID=549 RepID=UPI00301B9D9D
MATKEEIRQRLDQLVTDAHQVACSLDLGDERIEAFELYEVLRRLQRRGAASEMLAATNPLLAFAGDKDDDDWDEDDD